MKIVYGKWSNNPNGLTPKKIQKKKVLINNTEKRIVYSPALVINGRSFDEVATEPGEAICIVEIDKKYCFVVARELEMQRFIDFYYFNPDQAPGLVDFEDNYLTILGVPVSLKVINAYSVNTKKRLGKILFERELSFDRQVFVENVFLKS